MKLATDRATGFNSTCICCCVLGEKAAAIRRAAMFAVGLGGRWPGIFRVRSERNVGCGAGGC